MNNTQLHKMAEGRRKKAERERKAALERIEAFTRWIKSGCDKQHVRPVIELGLPTDNDYQITNGGAA